MTKKIATFLIVFFPMVSGQILADEDKKPDLSLPKPIPIEEGSEIRATIQSCVASPTECVARVLVSTSYENWGELNDPVIENHPVDNIPQLKIDCSGNKRLVWFEMEDGSKVLCGEIRNIACNRSTYIHNPQSFDIKSNGFCSIDVVTDKVDIGSGFDTQRNVEAIIGINFESKK